MLGRTSPVTDLPEATSEESSPDEVSSTICMQLFVALPFETFSLKVRNVKGKYIKSAPSHHSLLKLLYFYSVLNCVDIK